MKNKLLSIIKMAVSFGLMWGLGYLAHQHFDWWITAVVAGVVCFFIPIKTWQSFAMGLAAYNLLWGLQANALDALNVSLLSTKMGELFGGISPMELIYATAMIGGILGAFGAMTGSLWRQIFFPMTKKERLVVPELSEGG